MHETVEADFQITKRIHGNERRFMNRKLLHLRPTPTHEASTTSDPVEVEVDQAVFIRP
jgi:hypothetical protein